MFGPLPNLDALPANVGPVADPQAKAAWVAMEEAEREAVTTVFANIGKAVAALERTIDPPMTRFDAWVASAEFP